MGSNDHRTTQPTNWGDIGETRLFRLCLAPTHGSNPVETNILLDAANADEVRFRAYYLGVLLSIECECQIELREFELYE